MKNYLLLSLALAASLMLWGCNILPYSTLGAGPDAAAVDDTENVVEFEIVKSTGLVQYMDPDVGSWQFAKAGDKLNLYCVVRTGFNSSAELVMSDGREPQKLTLTSLLPAFELFDAYEKLLAEPARTRYVRENLGRNGKPIGICPITVSRDTLNARETSDFIAMSNFKNQDDGRAAAMVGGAGGGGGCGPGG